MEIKIKLNSIMNQNFKLKNKQKTISAEFFCQNQN